MSTRIQAWGATLLTLLAIGCGGGGATTEGFDSGTKDGSLQGDSSSQADGTAGDSSSGADSTIQADTGPSSADTGIAAEGSTTDTGSGSDSSSVTDSGALSDGATYTIGGSVTGVSGTLVLQDNGGSDLTLTGSGNFSFSTPVAGGGTFDVTVATQPAGQTCTVTGGSGTVSANVTTVVVTCVASTDGGDGGADGGDGGADGADAGDAPAADAEDAAQAADAGDAAEAAAATFAVGGTVMGMVAGSSVVLQDNGGDNLTVGADGSFTFVTRVSGAYDVTVFTQPPGQICTVSAGTGTVMGANVTQVVVTCSTPTFTIGGTVSGLLTGQSVTLTDNGGNATTVTGPGAAGGSPFTFSQGVASGAAFQVAVSANPTSPYWQTCTVTANGSGTVASAPVTNVAVTCTLGGNGSSGTGPSNGPIDPFASSVNAAIGSVTATLPGPASGFGFQAGQVVLFHQTQGTGAGAWELGTVVAAPGSTLTLLQPLQNTYTSDAGSDHAQVIVVPQYAGAMSVSGTLTAPAWNGTTGGILVFMDSGAVSVSGTINMSAAGFRGGGFANTAANCDTHCIFGVQGESAVGVGTNGGNTLAALTSNGAGGGGGAKGQDCGMGAGGAYATAGTSGVNNTNGTCNSSADGNAQAGTVDGSVNLDASILFGGGGGEGGYDEDGALPGNGGAGGGIVIIFASSITVTGSITSGGGAGGNGTKNCPIPGGKNGGGTGMGGGGGGAGGAIQLTAGSLTLGTSLVAATGTAGGMCSAGATNSGTGGAGRVGVKLASGAISGTTNPVYTLE
jgi:hypothetical protein